MCLSFLLTQICVTRCICLHRQVSYSIQLTEQMISFSYTVAQNLRTVLCIAYPAYWFRADSCTAAVVEKAQMFPANRS